MLRHSAALWCLLLLVAGCGTSGYRKGTNTPDWAEVGDNAPLITIPSAEIAPPSQSSLVAASIQTNTTVAPVFPLLGQPNDTWVPLQRWTRANGSVALSRVTPALVPTYTLRSANGTLTLRHGSQAVQWDGLELRLGFAPQLIDGQPYVHTLDLAKTIVPLLQGNGAGMNTKPVLVIDPGHGGENAGTRSVLGNHYEKEFTLDWAVRLQALLSANHWQVFLTRSNDVDLALSNRVSFAAEHKANLFLSLHFNSAAPNETQAGLETYCLTPAGMPSTVTREFADETDVAFPNNNFDEQNLLWALRVHRALLQINGHHDRGVRRARFPGVLRGQDRPAVLVEGGYLSNPHEARLISDPAYRQKLAEAVAMALVGSGKTEVRDQRSEIRGQRAEASSQSINP